MDQILSKILFTLWRYIKDSRLFNTVKLILGNHANYKLKKLDWIYSTFQKLLMIIYRKFAKNNGFKSNKITLWGNDVMKYIQELIMVISIYFNSISCLWSLHVVIIPNSLFHFILWILWLFQLWKHVHCNSIKDDFLKINFGSKISTLNLKKNGRVTLYMYLQTLHFT